MELRDYLRMLRRGWPAIVLITVLFAGLSYGYAVLSPKRYEATTVLFISTSDPRTTEDLSTGSSFALNNVGTYAKIVDSEAVLGPVAADMQPQRDVNDLIGLVTAVVPEETTLINVTAAAPDRQEAANLANATAASAARVIPGLQLSDLRRPLVQVQQLRPAVQPTIAISPDVKRIVSLGVIIGICVGLAVTITAQTLDTRVRGADDVRGLTEIPVLGEIPHSKRSGQNPIALRDDPANATAEAFRRLRTNVGFMEQRQRRSMVFASLTEGRYAAQVPINLAVSLAKAGWRVLLVDLDMRRWTVGDTLGLRRGAGLADVLLAQVDLSHVVRDTQERRLRVVLSGTTQTSPSDLLSAPIMNNVLLRMERSFDYVILHAPPVLSYTDATVVSRAAGGAFLTVASGRTRTHELTTALDTLQNARVEPLGLVLTGTRFLDGIAAFIGNGFRRGRPGPTETVVGTDEQTLIPTPPRELGRPRPSPHPHPTPAPTAHPVAHRPSPVPTRPAAVPGPRPDTSDAEATHRLLGAVQPQTASEPSSDAPSEASSEAAPQGSSEASAERQEDWASNASSSEETERRPEPAERANWANGIPSEPESAVRPAEQNGTGDDDVADVDQHPVAQAATAGPERTS